MLKYDLSRWELKDVFEPSDWMRHHAVITAPSGRYAVVGGIKIAKNNDDNSFMHKVSCGVKFYDHDGTHRTDLDACGHADRDGSTGIYDAVALAVARAHNQATSWLIK